MVSLFCPILQSTPLAEICKKCFGNHQPLLQLSHLCVFFDIFSPKSAQLSGLEAVVFASPKSLHLCSVCLRQWRVPQFALKYLCNPPPPLEWGETIARYGRIFQGERVTYLPGAGS